MTDFWGMYPQIKFGAPNTPNQDGLAGTVVEEIGAPNVAMVLDMRGQRAKTELLASLFSKGFWTQQELDDFEGIPGAVWRGPRDPALEPLSGVYGHLLLEHLTVDTNTSVGTVAPAGTWLLKVTLYLGSRSSQHLDSGSGGVMGFHVMMDRPFRPDMVADASDVYLLSQLLPSQTVANVMDQDLPAPDERLEYDDDGMVNVVPRGRGRRGWSDMAIPPNFKALTVVVSAVDRAALGEAITAMRPEWATPLLVACASTGVLRWGENKHLMTQGASCVDEWIYNSVVIGVPTAPVRPPREPLAKRQRVDAASTTRASTSTPRHTVFDHWEPPAYAKAIGLERPDKPCSFIEQIVKPHVHHPSFWQNACRIQLAINSPPENDDTWATTVARGLGAFNVAALILMRGQEFNIVRTIVATGRMSKDQLRELERIRGAIWQGPEDEAWDPLSGVYGHMFFKEENNGDWVLERCYCGLARHMKLRPSGHLEKGGGVYVMCCDMQHTFEPPADWFTAHPTRDEFTADDIDDDEEDLETAMRRARTWSDLRLPKGYKAIFVRTLGLERATLETFLARKLTGDVGKLVTGLLRWSELDEMIAQGATPTSVAGWRMACMNVQMRPS